ncbi:hypothetical protein DXG01_013090, partial [Tephrocybe rancida]
MADGFWPPLGALMELDDDDVIMGLCPASIAPVPISVLDISMLDSPAPAVPTLPSRLGPAAAPSPIASASTERTRKSGPRTSLPFALVVQYKRLSHHHQPRPPSFQPLQSRLKVWATPLAPFCIGGFQQHLQRPTGSGESIPQAWITPNSPIRFGALNRDSDSSSGARVDCHLSPADLSTPYNTVLVEAPASSILSSNPSFLASTSSLSWSGSIHMDTLPQGRTPLRERAPPLDLEIRRERKEAEDKTLKEKEARK